MQKTIQIILITVGVLILIFLSASFSYQLGKSQVPLPPEPTLLEKSKVIQSQRATARGEVIEIKDRTLTLSAEGDTLAIPIKEGAGVIVLISEEGAEPRPKEIEFRDIKVRDQVVVQIELLAEGKFEGRSITIFPTE